MTANETINKLNLKLEFLILNYLNYQFSCQRTVFFSPKHSGFIHKCKLAVLKYPKNSESGTNKSRG